MSWYNSTSTVAKGWLAVFAMPALAIAIVVAELIYDDEEDAMSAVSRLLVCPITGHDWADDDPYGVKPVCLNCGTERT